MFTWGSRNLLTIALFAYVGAIIHGISTGGGLIGTLSMGYKGGVGDHVGYSILMGVAFVALLLGVVTIATREGQSEDMSAAAGVDRALAVRPPSQPSYWAPMAAFGVACIALGAAVSQAFLILGLVIIAVTGMEWAMTAWSDRATGDPEVNSVIRSRMLSPFEVPMLALLGIAVVVLGVSRVLLAAPSKTASTTIVVLVAAAIFGCAILFAKSRASRAVMSGVLAFGAVAVLAGGVVGAALGEREIKHHGEHSEDHGDDHDEEGEG